MKKILILLFIIGSLVVSQRAEAGFIFRPTYTKNILGKNSGRVFWNTTQNNRYSDDLISFWSFNGPDVDITTNQIFDRIGGFTGTIINGATSSNFVAGRVGQGFRFLGGTSNNVVSIPDNASLRPASISISAWFNCRTFATSHAVISKPVTAPPWSTPFTSWLIRINSVTAIEFGIAGSSYVGSAPVISSMITNQWYHVAMTYTPGTKKGYLNGVQISSVSQAGAIQYGAFPVLIGGDHGASPYGDLASCTIDDVRLYNRVLSLNEVLRLYNAGK